MSATSLLPTASSVSIKASVGPQSTTFQFEGEDHTLGNSLRYVIMRNPQTNFCGYTVPHPSEPKMNMRVQTGPDTTSKEVLRDGLVNLRGVCRHVKATFQEACEEKKSMDIA